MINNIKDIYKKGIAKAKAPTLPKINTTKELTKATKATRLTKLALEIGIAKNIMKKPDSYVGKITFNTLKDLGPTFVKIGQFISTRSDIFGEEFTNELKMLQDNVSPMSIDDIQPYINQIQDNFEYIDKIPIAAASIGQVHIGKLNDGKSTAIKFKRVNIDKTINSDFVMLLSIIDFVKLFVSHRQVTEVEISLKEYYNLLLEEIDFKNEVKNMKAFKKQFRNTKWIKVPTPYEHLCNNDIIVMEYVPSIKINDLHKIKEARLDSEKISEKLLQCFFTQVVQYGFVHIDPHPGNVGLTIDGKIVFYDYGMFVKLDGTLKDNIKSLFLAMYDRDVNEVSQLLIDLEIINVEPSKVSSFKKFIASFLDYIDNLDIDNFKLSYLDKIDQSEMQFLISSKFILLLRGITILEGVCKSLNPDFNYREILDPFISDFIIDIQYLERRGRKDISRFRSANDKIATSEISIDLMENEMGALKKKVSVADVRNKYVMSAVVFALQLQAETVESKIVLALAFLYIILNR